MPDFVHSPPEHLSSESWVDFELRAALSTLDPMLLELGKLKAKIAKENVHKSRVSLRRWFSVWGLLAEDGWEKKKFKKKVLKPLREFLKHLGQLRDCDVNIETAGKLDVSDSTLEGFKKERKKLKASVDKKLRKIDVDELKGKIEKYLKKSSLDLTEHLDDKESDHSAYSHFERYISDHEANVKTLAANASTPESLHKLRLAIKKWRYLLTECMGLTTLDLVNAQTLLGEIHDLDRLEPILIKSSRNDEAALTRLRKERASLIADFEKCKKDLPYGLRPGIISLAR